MTMNDQEKRRLFVLDTNVLMHDPTSIFRFQEHDIFLPMVVLEELDKGKKGLSEVARNVRQVSRFLDELMSGASKKEIDAGLPLPTPANGKSSTPLTAGRLYFQTTALANGLPPSLPGNTPDNNI
ncbi:MAG: PIN domain-containing protein, partial [Sedimenticola sp.]|nr:PIN domain-containing protein [Sedimenticola sp.]